MARARLSGALERQQRDAVMRYELQHYILNGGRMSDLIRTKEQPRDEPATCPACGGESRSDRRVIVFEEGDNMVEGDCEHPWHEPKVHERSAHITLET